MKRGADRAQGITQAYDYAYIEEGSLSGYTQDTPRLAHLEHTGRAESHLVLLILQCSQAAKVLVCEIWSLERFLFLPVESEEVNGGDGFGPSIILH